MTNSFRLQIGECIRKAIAGFSSCIEFKEDVVRDETR